MNPKLHNFSDYEFLDSGNGRRLERFSDVLVERPAPQAIWTRDESIVDWQQAKVSYNRDVPNPGWSGMTLVPDHWQVRLDSLYLELRLSENGQVGIFPEQLENWFWLKSILQRQNRPIRVLNAFAYTGAATLMAASAGAHVDVCHVDAAKSAVNWAKRNAELSGLKDRRIRWIADDALTFLAREERRGQRYDAFILDPPAFGRAAGKSWKLERDLPDLLKRVGQLLSDQPLFVILSCHAPGLSANDLSNALRSLRGFEGRASQTLPLDLKSKKSAKMSAGYCARISRLS